MRSITLGRTGVEVPVVSVGTWGHSGPARVKRHAVGWAGGDDDAARAALLRACELGLSHWDTADAYGNGHSEEMIGGLWQTVPRSQVFLASKTGWVKGSAHGYEPDHMRRQIESSLRRLRTETIDLYYLHHCDFGPDDRYLDSAIALLREFQAAGRVRWIGLSDWDSAKVARYAPVVEPDVVQVYRSLLHDPYHESGLADWVAVHGAGVCFFSPLQHGLLLGKYRKPPELDPGDHRSGRPEFRDADLLARLRRCRRAVEVRFVERAQPLLDALLTPLVADVPGACVLVGMRRPEHAEAAAEVCADLSAADIDWVRRLYRGLSSP
ncbi:MAG: aldo/keto reductase [Acidobacteria bacterium]|nr:aldo/keto reductase [Acidobacteriota bacterium]